MKLFVSYARVDKPLCKQVVERLSDVHDVWYDKRLHAGQDWWQEIQERLDWCEGFVYLLSPESVASEYCQKEFTIASNAGKHLFPVLIQARTNIPSELSHIHFADLSNGMEDVITLMNALTIAERQHRKPAKPTSAKPVDAAPKMASPSQALADAADAMDSKNFDKAVFIIKQALAQKPEGRTLRFLENLLKEADLALEKQTYLREAEREYASIRELMGRDSTRGMACIELEEFLQEFPDYDPDELQKICLDFSNSQAEIPVPSQTRTLVESPKAPTIVISKPKAIDLLPAPFDWIEIPKKGYSIAKYPVTNAQFAKFIEAGGYKNKQWWTKDGWQKCQEGWHYDGGWKVSGNAWTEPRYWKDSKWNGAEQPVVGVSWYESVAFCLWLSDATDEKIMLPTEEQWQYAAQGDDGRLYPWGNNWDASRCNNNVGYRGIFKTSPVRHYEGKGNSPFGVVDMAGNVWEWCLTEYDNNTNDLNTDNTLRILRGGSWFDNLTGNFRCDGRSGYYPHSGPDGYSFRLLLSFQ